MKVDIPKSLLIKWMGKKCLACKTSKHLTLDHIRSRAKGGRDVIIKEIEALLRDSTMSHGETAK